MINDDSFLNFAEKKCELGKDLFTIHHSYVKEKMYIGDQIKEKDREIREKYDAAKEKLLKFFVPFDNIIYTGLENKIEEGPNLIIANHPGIARDIGSLLKLYTRPLFFTPRKELFDKNELNQLIKDFYKRHLSKYGSITATLINKMLTPIRNVFSDYVPKIMKETKMISIDLNNHKDKRAAVKNLRESIEKIKTYLKNERAVVIFQTPISMINGNETEREISQYHDYLYKFNTTCAKIVNEIYKEDKKIIPITPISIYNAEGLNPFKRMKVNIGKAMTIEPYLKEENLIIELTQDLEKTIATLLEKSGLHSKKNMDEPGLSPGASIVHPSGVLDEVDVRRRDQGTIPLF